MCFYKTPHGFYSPHFITPPHGNSYDIIYAFYKWKCKNNNNKIMCPNKSIYSIILYLLQSKAMCKWVMNCNQLNPQSILQFDTNIWIANRNNFYWFKMSCRSTQSFSLFSLPAVWFYAKTVQGRVGEIYSFIYCKMSYHTNIFLIFLLMAPDHYGLYAHTLMENIPLISIFIGRPYRDL